MATFTSTATERRATSGLIAEKGPAYSAKTLVTTVEVAADASVGTTYDFGRIPSNARILPSSTIYWDDLGTGSTTLDLGLAEVDGNLVNSDDPDALSNGHSVAGGASSASVVTDIANAGLPAWDFVLNESSDPGGSLDVYGSIADAAVTSSGAGTLTMELFYYVD